MKKILISAANGPIMPELITYLRKSYYVIGIDSNNTGLAKNYCNKFYKSPKGSDNKFIKFINKIGMKADLIFLFVDEELVNVSQNLNKLKRIRDKIVISPKETIITCNDKIKFQKYFENFKQINLPSLNKKKKSIIKPNIGRGSKNIIITEDFKVIECFKSNKNFIVQEYINGKEYTVDCLFDNNGALIFSLPRERIISQNVSLVGKITKNKKITDFVKYIGTKMKFSGPINIQLKIRKKKIYLIEINPRLSGSIYFAIKSGFNPFWIIIKKKISKEYKLKNLKINYNKTFYRYLKSV